VLAGKVAGPPVPLPGKAKAGPPPNGPELSALALRASDLGQAKVVHQGYRLDSDLNPISEYERQVSPAGAFGFLQEEVALFHTPTEASYTFGILAEGLSSSELMKHALAGEKSSDISSWQATPVPGIRVGDESRVVQARLGFRGGGAGYAAFVLVRIGSTTEFVIVSRLTAARIEPASLKRLAALVAERARQGLKR
jgi:hypothetical protein